MLGKLIPILFLFIGTAAGVGAGLVLAPAEEEAGYDTETAGDKDGNGKDKADHKDTAEKDAGQKDDGYGDEADGSVEYVKLNNQFVVPILQADKVAGMVVMSLSLEVPPGSSESIYSREPKLRDAILRVLFDHANIGGFSGAFTNSNNLDVLRIALREAATQTLSKQVYDVLILDIARQDV
ncbi:MAG: flagellar basal body-associated FliL family protein [Pseudomonadota bacterium]